MLQAGHAVEVHTFQRKRGKPWQWSPVTWRLICQVITSISLVNNYNFPGSAQMHYEHIRLHRESHQEMLYILCMQICLISLLHGTMPYRCHLLCQPQWCVHRMKIRWRSGLQKLTPL